MLRPSSSSIGDLRTMVIEPSDVLKAYILFLLTVCVFAIVKLASTWRAVVPFRSAGNLAALTWLESNIESLRYWRGQTYRGWGIFASISLQELCNRLLDLRRLGDMLVVFLIRELSRLNRTRFRQAASFLPT